MTRGTEYNPPCSTLRFGVVGVKCLTVRGACVSLRLDSGGGGHSSVRITERHYKPWAKTLQKKLEDEVRKAWA